MRSELTYRLLRWLNNLFVRLTCRLEIDNLERLPRSGAFVVASNHLGILDPLLTYYFIDRQDIIMLVAEKYGDYALARWLARQVDGIFVDRYGADFGAVRKALQRLRNGGVLVLAPEGTRSPTGALIEGRHGVGFLAAKAGVPIYPVGITGTEDRKVLAWLMRFKRARVIGSVGKPFTLPELERHDRGEAMAQYTDEIMCQIAALLPPEYRGVYANHPRLLEIIESATDNKTLREKRPEHRQHE